MLGGESKGPDMMKRAEAEAGIRDLATKWARETGYKPRQGHYPSFADFRSWVELQHYGNYFSFRSTVGAAHDAEQWFEDEIKRWTKPFLRD